MPLQHTFGSDSFALIWAGLSLKSIQSLSLSCICAASHLKQYEKVIIIPKFDRPRVLRMIVYETPLEYKILVHNQTSQVAVIPIPWWKYFRVDFKLERRDVDYEEPCVMSDQLKVLFWNSRGVTFKCFADSFEDHSVSYLSPSGNCQMMKWSQFEEALEGKKPILHCLRLVCDSGCPKLYEMSMQTMQPPNLPEKDWKLLKDSCELQMKAVEEVLNNFDTTNVVQLHLKNCSDRALRRIPSMCSKARTWVLQNVTPSPFGPCIDLPAALIEIDLVDWTKDQRISDCFEYLNNITKRVTGNRIIDVTVKSAIVMGYGENGPRLDPDRFNVKFQGPGTSSD